MGDTPASTTFPQQPRVTLRTIRRWMKAGEPFAMLTCYDATTAGWLWRGGIRTVLVGDTAAQMILGHDSTLPVSMDFMIEITAAVRRGAPDMFIMADMPFGSYQCSDDQAMHNATRFLKEAGADVVKLEVDATFAPLVRRMAAAGIPVVAHLGSRPQQVRAQGGFQSAGRKQVEAELIVEASKLMMHEGASMVLLEAVPAEVSSRVVDLAVNSRKEQVVPVIGCGAGPACHGHVVVLHDLLGLTDWQPPFIKPVADVGQQIADAAGKWAELIASGQYLRDDHPYKLGL
jgi:3-methyl-2-oxobutanoate hydroxymethyltransferase